jgi:nucleotide-binding universal stress UspA family protein
MKTILFPTDFSACAEHAAEYVAGIAQKTGAKIILLHSYHVPVMVSSEYTPVEQVSSDAIEKNASEDLEKFMEKKNFKGIVTEKYIIPGFAGDDIVSMAEEKQADLIVMGTTGASGMKEIFIGSIASKVIGKARCPVLVVPRDAAYAPFKRIGYATNYKEKEFETIQSLCDIATLYDAEVHIVHMEDVLYTDELARDMFQAFKEEARKKISYGKLSFHFISGMRVAESLNTFIEENKIDMLSLSTRKRNILSKLFDHSLSKKMACHSHVPVLAFHLK